MLKDHLPFIISNTKYPYKFVFLLIIITTFCFIVDVLIAKPPDFKIPELYKLFVKITSYNVNSNELTINACVTPLAREVPLRNIYLQLDIPKDLGISIKTIHNDLNHLIDNNVCASFSFIINLNSFKYFDEWFNIYGEISYDINDIRNYWVKNATSSALYNALIKAEINTFPSNRQIKSDFYNKVNIFYTVPISYQSDGIFLLAKYLKPQLTIDIGNQKLYFWNPLKYGKFQMNSLQSYFEKIDESLNSKNYTNLESVINDLLSFINNNISSTQGIVIHDFDGSEFSFSKNIVDNLLQINLNAIKYISYLKKSPDLLIKQYENFKMKKRKKKDLSTSNYIYIDSVTAFDYANLGLLLAMSNMIDKANEVFSELLILNPAWLKIMEWKKYYKIY